MPFVFAAIGAVVCVGMGWLIVSAMRGAAAKKLQEDAEHDAKRYGDDDPIG